MAEKRTGRNVKGLIAEYEWLRRMMVHLEMQTEGIDRQLLELEKCLPDDYSFPGDPEMKES